MDETKKAEIMEERLSLDEQFRFCERIIEDSESGTFSTVEMQARFKDCKERLENLTREVNARNLFSTNETFDELPTSSLKYLLLPSYLATTIQNIIVEPEYRVDALDKSKVYLRNFLERLLSYEVINFTLPWLEQEDEEEDIATKMKSKSRAEQIRENKVQRQQHQVQLETNFKELKLERSQNADDDSVLRELLLTRIRLYALKALNDLEQIDEERPLAEHMVEVRAGRVPHQQTKPKVSSKPPIIITRDAVQKKVFGLGYPSIPTVTVDEWCNDMMKHGRFGDMLKGPSNNEKASESEEDDEATEEEKRANAQRWDEYKDMHRRGWGNTHNKG